MEALPSYHGSSPSYDMSVDLNGNPYVVQMTWNSRTEYWHLSISDKLGGLISGIKVVPNWPLLKNHRGQITLDGELMVLPTKEGLTTIEYDGIGKDWLLLYMTEEDMTEWESYINGIG